MIRFFLQSAKNLIKRVKPIVTEAERSSIQIDAASFYSISKSTIK
ncbi:hypothetical protein [Bacillus anthracis]|nr:hypothetical protein [Bacillus anthracis]